MDKDTEIFKGKSFSDIAKDLYSASKKKESQINLLIHMEGLLKLKHKYW